MCLLDVLKNDTRTVSMGTSSKLLHGAREKTINNGVYVKGIIKGGEDDCYGIIQHIYELEYNALSYPKKVVVFYCDWFDPSRKRYMSGSKIYCCGYLNGCKI